MTRLLSPGDVVERYEVEGFLGEGGLSEVFKVRHRDLGSVHALKVLALDLPNIHERILAEGRVQATVKHPNVVTVSDVIDVRGRPGLVMEYVDGVSLRDWLLGHQPSLDEALHLFAGVVRGVRAAHRRGLAHRDLKPENVLLAQTEQGLLPKVMDFGLVKILADDVGQTQTGVMMGTPQYMAPEQIRDASRVDHRADIFSLGCMLYGMVCGLPAFRGSDVVTILNRTSAGEYTDPQVIRPDLPDHVAEAIRRMLRTDPDARPQTTDEVLEALFPEHLAPSPRTDEVPRRSIHPDDTPTVPIHATRVLAPAMGAPMPGAAVGWIATAMGVTLLAAGVLMGFVT